MLLFWDCCVIIDAVCAYMCAARVVRRVILYGTLRLHY